jgi:hypothetical protein
VAEVEPRARKLGDQLFERRSNQDAHARLRPSPRKQRGSLLALDLGLAEDQRDRRWKLRDELAPALDGPVLAR